MSPRYEEFDSSFINKGISIAKDKLDRYASGHWEETGTSIGSVGFIPLNLGNGEIKVKWLATTGHTTDTWTFTVYPNSKRVYKNQIPELDKIYK